MLRYKVVECLIILLFVHVSCEDEHCYNEQSKCSENISGYEKNARYLFYDINPPEGFNLRRDVYMRMAVLAHNLQKSKNENINKFKMILPPWSRLVHWSYKESPEQIPWGLYFDIESLRKFAPVIELHEFFSKLSRNYKKIEVDETYVLQHFEDMFSSGNFDDRMKIEKCSKKYNLNYFYYTNITSKSIKCLSYHGPATKLQELLNNSNSKTILLHHAEVALHDMYGSKLYWQARRSMRFSKELKEIAAQFRGKYLNSDDKKDNISLPEDWRDESPNRRPKGGPYLSVHLRRADFLRGRRNEIPSLESAVEQITQHLNKLNLQTVFVATDATVDEYKEILRILPKNYRAVRYKPIPEIETKYGDGGIAIIDQIICSHSKFFIGTSESTFSFRIQEEREILGFPSETTFNSFCKDKNNCNEPSVWKIVY